MKRSSHAVFLQRFLIPITNLKAIVFYIALLPQFIDHLTVAWTPEALEYELYDG